MIVAYNDGYYKWRCEMKKSKRLIVEWILLGISSAGLVLGVVETIVGVYLGPVIAVGCAVGVAVCIRNIRRIKKEVTG
jgi:hypothetical protein